MTTPDTQEPTEQDEALLEVLTEWAQVWPDPEDAARQTLESLQPVLASIRRQAAADALREQARSLGKRGAFMREQARSHVIKGNSTTAVSYDAMADTYYYSANSLRAEADGIIAEGYEYECAGGCETPVPDAGDECAKCWAEGDDEDRWAE